jgi:hypothetical protein
MFSWVSCAHYSFLEIDKGFSKIAKNPNIFICDCHEGLCGRILLIDYCGEKFDVWVKKLLLIFKHHALSQ